MTRSDRTDRGTEAVLNAVAERLTQLDESGLQQEVQGIQQQIQEVNRQSQERQFVIQFRQLALQRVNERAAGLPVQQLEALNPRVHRAIVQIHEVFAEFDDQTLQGEINLLQAQLQELNRRAQERSYALTLKQMLAQRPQGLPQAVAAPVAPRPSTTAQFGETDIEGKREAILDVLRQNPNRAWSPAQIRKILAERGIPDPDAGTPIRNLMWRMARDGLLDRPRAGVYALGGPNVPREHGDRSDPS